MRIADFGQKNILILGLAREGRSVFEFLRKNFPSQKITIWDQAPQEKIPNDYKIPVVSDPNVEIRYSVGSWKSITTWDNYDIVIKSAGIPLKDIPQDQYTKLSSETRMFFDLCPSPIIGVTGTKGKSTTSSLIYEMLKAGDKKTILVGNIGSPALDHLEEIDEDTLVVFELSSHQLQSLKKSPHVAVLLNVYPEHLDYYTDFEDYWQAKANITMHQTDNDYLIFNTDNEIVRNIGEKTKAKKLPFSRADMTLGKELLKKSKLIGDFNALNIIAAMKVAQIFGVGQEAVKRALATFKPLPHRIENIGTYRGITFYNDSIATIPEATISALEVLGKDVQTIFLGGFDRGIDYKKLAEYLLKNSKITNLILFSPAGDRIWQEICILDSNAKKKYSPFFTDSMNLAVKQAYAATSIGHIALLSCAAPSFGIFRDYTDRGNQFKEQVVKLAQNER